MNATDNLKDAVKRSYDQNEIVHIDYEGGDLHDLLAELRECIDPDAEGYDLDYAEVDGLIDVWFYDTTDMAASGTMEWRLKVTLQGGLVYGKQVQIDLSGVGHNWVDAGPDELPASIREEIECEMIDGKKEECDEYVASNGLHYRWSDA